jgi:hypothetical protein
MGGHGDLKLARFEFQGELDFVLGKTARRVRLQLDDRRLPGNRSGEAFLGFGFPQINERLILGGRLVLDFLFSLDDLFKVDFPPLLARLRVEINLVPRLVDELGRLIEAARFGKVLVDDFLPLDGLLALLVGEKKLGSAVIAVFLRLVDDCLAIRTAPDGH